MYKNSVLMRIIQEKSEKTEAIFGFYCVDEVVMKSINIFISRISYLNRNLECPKP